MLVISAAQVEALVDSDALIDALAPAMAEFSAGHADAPDRMGVSMPEQEGPQTN